MTGPRRKASLPRSPPPRPPTARAEGLGADSAHGRHGALCVGSKFSPAPLSLAVFLGLRCRRRRCGPGCAPCAPSPTSLSAARPAAMANVADTKLYDILGVPPGASENELKKVVGSGTAGQGVRGAGLLGWGGQAALRGCPRAGAGRCGFGPGGGSGSETGLGWPWAVGPARPQMQQIKPTPAQTRRERFLPPSPGRRRRPGAPGRLQPARPSPRGGHHPGKTGWTEAHSASRPQGRSLRRGRRLRSRVRPGSRAWRAGWGRPRRCLGAVGDVSWVPQPQERLSLFLLRSPTPCVCVLFCGQVAWMSVPASGVARGSQPNTWVYTKNKYKALLRSAVLRIFDLEISKHLRHVTEPYTVFTELQVSRFVSWEKMRLLLRPWDGRVESKMDFLLPYRKC